MWLLLSMWTHRVHFLFVKNLSLFHYYIAVDPELFLKWPTCLHFCVLELTKYFKISLYVIVHLQKLACTLSTVLNEVSKNGVPIFEKTYNFNLPSKFGAPWQKQAYGSKTTSLSHEIW